VVAAINDTNGGLYMALMEQYGRPEEAGAYTVMSLESGPFLTMVTLGVAGLSAFPWQTLTGAILPLAAGMVLGNLDSELRKFLAPAAPVLIPFFAFALGATLDLHRLWRAGLVGVALGIGVVVVSGTALVVADRLAGGNGTAGIAAASTAGNAAAVPAIGFFLRATSFRPDLDHCDRVGVEVHGEVLRIIHFSTHRGDRIRMLDRRGIQQPGAERV